MDILKAPWERGKNGLLNLSKQKAHIARNPAAQPFSAAKAGK